MAISSIGVGSGLPLDTLLTSLRNSENVALQLIQTKQVAVQGRLSAYGKISSALATLKSAADTLSTVDTFGALKASVNSDSITATASTEAIAGQYNIIIDALATTQTLTTVGLADRTAANGVGGTVTFTMGSGDTKTLDLTGKDTSLNGLVGAINGDPSLGISATVINDGTASPFRLLLTSTTTGVDASVAKISIAGNATLQGVIEFDKAAPGPNITELAAANALIHINGIAITSQTNQISTAIDGVTLTLNKANPIATTLSVTQDNSVASNAVNAFVTAYNSLQSTIKSLTAYNVDTKNGSALTGDSLARRVQNQVRDVLNVATSTGTVRSLSQLGIKTQADGTLKVDATALSAGLGDHLADVTALFTGSNGVATKLSAVTDGFLSSSGLLTTTTAGINKTITDLQKQYDATSARIDATMANYTKQFSALDSMVAQMNSVSTYLTQQLSMLGNQNSNK